MSAQGFEELVGFFAGLVGNKISVFSQDISSDFDDVFVNVGKTKSGKQFVGGILLKVLSWFSSDEASNDMDDSIPYIFGNIVSGVGNQSDNDINVPNEIISEFFGENGNLENKFFFDREIRFVRVVEEFLDDSWGSGWAAHNVEDIKGSSSDGDIVISEKFEDSLQVLLNEVFSVRSITELADGFKGQVSRRINAFYFGREIT